MPRTAGRSWQGMAFGTDHSVRAPGILFLRGDNPVLWARASRG